MKRGIILSIVLTAISFAVFSKTIGSWNIYPAYYDITEIVPTGNDIFVLSSNNLFSYNVKDHSISTYDKSKNLSDCDISHIAWNSSAKRLIIAYTNSNIDLIDIAGDTNNISELYNKATTSDKTINSIMINGIYAYISTGFGIVKVNVKDAEISETYNISANIKSTAIIDNNIYALCSDNRILTALLSTNLSDKSNWTYTNSPISSIFDTGSKDFVYDNINKCYWTKDNNGKLISETKNNDNSYTITSSGVKPDGPKYNYFNYMKYKYNKLYTCGGRVIAGSFFNRKGTVQVLDNDNWNVFEDEIDDITKVPYLDVSSISIDPNDTTHIFAASARTALYEFYKGKYKNHYSIENSNDAIHSAIINNGIENPEYVLVTGSTYDNEGNLWLLTSQTKNTLIEYSKDKIWSTHNKNEISTSNGMLQNMIIDKNGNLWFSNNHWVSPALFYYDIKNDAVKAYKTFVNQSGATLELNGGIHCIAEDKEGNIWIGSNVGPLILSNTAIKNNNSIFTQVIIPRNDGTSYADYLLSGIDISCIAIDGANRKWIGTFDKGLYLISADNMTQIHHFISSNSSLLSDAIESLAINDNTGEVFIGTDKGLCSYMSDATVTYDNMTKDNVYAYPNPVDPNYTGLISIVGLSYNSNVKIITASGTIITEGISNGGMFTWDGKDKHGNRVASGIYFAVTAKSDGSSGTVCKIAMIK
ncbi:MAG: Por secretion system protein [Prevotella sp.]|nr:Por secretion system protein [Prevotella sp.]